MNRKLSDRDKKLLLVIAALLIACIPYLLIVSPYMDKTQVMKAEVETLINRKKYLEQLSANIGEYQEMAVNIAVDKEKILSRFPSELLQEENILFIYNTEKLIPIKLQQVTFGTDFSVPITSTETAQQIQAVEEVTDNVTQDEVITDNIQTAEIGEGLTGSSSETQFTFEAGYREFKDFLKYIKDYNDRMVITNITASYSGETDVVSGNFTLMRYAIGGEDRLPVRVTEPNLLLGTTNIFKQAAGPGTGIQEEQYRPDFFLLLSQPEADIEAKIFGQSNDATEATYLKSDDNSQQEVKIIFEGRNGEYTANYQIGNKEFGEEGVTFSKTGIINFEILSSPRVGENDKVAAKVNIVNNTDLTVSVKITEDDMENPRVNITGKTGVIAMK